MKDYIVHASWSAAVPPQANTIIGYRLFSDKMGEVMSVGVVLETDIELTGGFEHDVTCRAIYDDNSLGLVSNVVIVQLDFVFFSDLVVDGNFGITVSGIGTVHWDDTESTDFDGTDVYLSHTYSNFDGLLSIAGTLTKLSKEGENGNLNHTMDALPNTLTYYSNVGNQINVYNNGIVYNSGLTYFKHHPILYYGFSGDDVDRFLIDMDNSGVSSGVIDISGNNAPRTSFSDAAVDNMTNRGVTVITSALPLLFIDYSFGVIDTF